MSRALIILREGNSSIVEYPQDYVGTTIEPFIKKQMDGLSPYEKLFTISKKYWDCLDEYEADGLLESIIDKTDSVESIHIVFIADADSKEISIDSFGALLESIGTMRCSLGMSVFEDIFKISVKTKDLKETLFYTKASKYLER